MSDSFTETTSVSWFGRIGRSLGGVVVGVVLVIAMAVLLFWNEGRAVQTAKSLAEGASAVVSVKADAIDPANDGKLIHVSGRVVTGETPLDPDFAIASPGVRLVRSAEMYQWKEESRSETTKKLGGGEETVTTYTYSKVWDDSQLDSTEFRQPDGHGNPPMEIHGRSFQVASGALGAFDLGQPVLSRIGGAKALPISPERAEAVRAAYRGTARVSIVDGRIYLGRNPTSPAVGDYRISYEVVPAGEISVVARQAGSHFEAYPTVAGDELLMVRTGVVPADKMFADAVSENTLITWLLRAVGLVILFVGFALFMAPLGVLADIIPFVGSLVRLGTGVIAFLLATVVGTAVIALAWFWYRPLLALGIVAVGAVIAVAILRMGQSRQKAGGSIAHAPSPPSASVPPATAQPPKSSGKIAW